MAGRPTGRDPREVGGQWPRFQRHWFADPAPDLARFVAHYWAVRWDYRGQPPYRQLIVPSPNVHLSIGSNNPGLVHGVTRRHMFRVLAGAGQVFGVAFRPGWFRPFLGRPVTTITGRSVPAGEVFGPALPHQAVAAATDWPQAVRAIQEFLRAHAPPVDPDAEQAARIVTRIAQTPELTRVDDLAARVGIGVRQLQRLFAEHVGVGPKWMIRRYRLHEVTERMAAGAAVDWARLATELGYADQAHFTRDFTALVGESPTRYAARYPARTGHAIP